MHTYHLCSSTFKIHVYSAKYMQKKKKNPKLFCYLKYKGEVMNAICILCFLNNLICATQIFSWYLPFKKLQYSRYSTVTCCYQEFNYCRVIPEAYYLLMTGQLDKGSYCHSQNHIAIYNICSPKSQRCITKLFLEFPSKKGQCTELAENEKTE